MIPRLLTAAVVVAGLLAPGSAYAQTDPPPFEGEIQIASQNEYPDCGATLVKPGDRVTFDGQVPAGSTVKKAVMRQFDASGAQSGQDQNATVAIAADGAISGTSPILQHVANARTVALVLTVTRDAVDTTGVSNHLTFDRDEPSMTGAYTTSTRMIVVTFSEEVVHPQADSPTDWYIKGDPTLKPVRVTGTGSTRTLTFNQDNYGVDDEPAVTLGTSPLRETYEDCVGRAIPFEGRNRTAVDKITPDAPTIQSINGDATGTDDRAAGGAASFPVVIGGSTNGYLVQLWRESNNEDGFQTSDTLIDAGTIEGGTATISVASLGSDGEYTFYGRARDIHDNFSTGTDSAVYRLDNVAPTAVQAIGFNDKVTVAFSENLTTGRNNVADWRVESTGVGGITVTHTITGVTGSGSTRDLAISGAPNGARVFYTPPETNNYKDEVGLALAAFGPLTVEGLIPTTVNLEPETAPIPVNDNHTVTVTVTDDFGTTVPGGEVVLRAVSGPSSTRNVDGSAATPLGVIGTCSSNANGVCTFTWTSNQEDVDVIQAYLGSASSPPSPEARDESGADSKVQDVGEVTWTVAGAELSLDVDPESSSAPLNEPFLPTVDVVSVGGDFPGRGVADVNVDVRVLSGPNQGLWLDDCNTNANGECTMNFKSTVTGTDRLQFWIDSNTDNEVAGELTDTDGEDVDPDANPSPLAPPDDPAQDVITRTWTAAIVQIFNLEPELSSGNIGEARSMTFAVHDQNGDAIQGLDVDARVISGPNAGKHLGDCVTDVLGECRFTYTSNAKGTDSIQGWIDLDGNDLSNEVTQVEARGELPTEDETDQDVIEAAWTAGSDVLFLDASPETSIENINDQSTLTARVEDGSDIVRSNEKVAAQVVTGPNKSVDLDSSSATPAGYVGTCTSDGAGGCTLAYASALKGTDKVLLWLDADGNKQPNEVTTTEPAAESSSTDVPGHDVVEIEWVAEDAPTRLLTLGASENKTAFRTPVTLSGSLDVSGGCPVTTVSIERKRPGGEFNAWRSKDPSPDGSWSITFRPFRTASYRARVAGSGSCAALSDTTTVSVFAKVIAKLADDRIGTGTCVGIHGRVAPNKSGQTVTLQSQLSSGWQTVARATVGRKSLYRFRSCPEGAGKYAYRVRWAGDAKNLAATSSTLTLRVVR